MKKVRKRERTQRRFPQVAPCNHIPPAFPTKNGKLKVCVLPYRVVFHDTFPAKVWCMRCGWVTITNEQYEHYKEFDGYQEA